MRLASTERASNAGFLSFLQEVISNHIAGVPVTASRNAPAYEHALAAAKINSRAAKMAAYGAFISAPMNHVLVGALQKIFAGRTSGRAKLMQLLVSNVFIAPIQVAGKFKVLALLMSLTMRFSLSGVDGRHLRSQVSRCS